MKFLASSILVLSLPTAAMALPGVKQAKAQLHHSSRVQDACTDFHGTWQGQCTDGDGNVTDAGTTIIQTSCNTLNVDGTEVNMGGEAVQRDVTTALTGALSIFGDWSADQQTAMMTYNGAWRALGDVVNVSLTGTSSMTITNAQLNTTFSYSTGGTQNPPQAIAATCVYNNVANTPNTPSQQKPAH